jgi:predicted HAD superfamily Cof-like phosphohydrolase
MSKSQLDMVKEFHAATGSPVLPSPGVPPHDRVRLRVKLLFEETIEAAGAMIGMDEPRVKLWVVETNAIIDSLFDNIDPNSDLPNVGKELNDVLYVTHGAIAEYGLPESMFDAIHANNMTKIGGPMREDGKRGKPPGYKKFDAAKFLAENGWAN